MSIKDKYKVLPITFNECKEWLLYKHYLKRLVSCSYCFGLFDNEILVGICTFGNAVPNTMKKSIAGNDFMSYVYELNRLCTNDNLDKNANSFFVSRCFKYLPKPLIIVSYADKSVGHNGYIYQSLNFIYTGESHTQLDWKIRGQEHIHSRTLMDEFAFQENRIEKLKEKYGDNLYQVKREPKYRYIKILGSKTFKQKVIKNKLFNIKEYPKGDNIKYNANYNPSIQTKLL